MPPPPQQQPGQEAAELAALLTKLDIFSVSKPWRKPGWKSSNRRNKNVKQILSEVSRKEAAAQLAAKVAAEEEESNNAAAAAAKNNNDNNNNNTGEEADDADGDVPMKDDHVLAQSVGTMATPSSSPAVATAISAITTPVVTYSNVEAAPSMHPACRRPYCDITGLPAPYTDPKTRIRYHNKEIYAFISSISQEMADRYLDTRNASFTLK